MELAEETLQNRIERERFTTEDIKVIIKDIAQGLVYLHSRNQSHLDLKPANILRVTNRWKIGDYGLVRSLNSEDSYDQTLNLLGTPLYSPPESESGVISTAWDIWSLGIILAILLTGTYPVKYQTQEELREKISHARFDNLNFNSFEQPWQNILRGCLEVNCQERWTAEQILEALNPPVIIPPPSIVREFTEIIVKESSSGGKEIKLEMVVLPAGEFWMGSPDSDRDAYADEKPRHLVKIDSFAIGKYPITQEQYKAVMGENPSYLENKPKNPVECVTQEQARKFCQKLSERTGKKYRLPSEAEWEYACRAGSETRYYFGDDARELGEYAWYGGNSNEQTQAVGQKKANKWGLYDMHGNVWEWCEDQWHENYEGAPTYGKAWNDNSPQNSSLVLCGGAWNHGLLYCRSAYRDYYDSDDYDVGFRPALSVQDSFPFPLSLFKNFLGHFYSI
jgi:formylglycine-generating enzyme required for sulfatase activity